MKDVSSKNNTLTKETFLWGSLLIGLGLLISGLFTFPDTLKGFWETAEDTKTVLIFSISGISTLLALSLLLRSLSPLLLISIYIICPIAVLLIATGVLPVTIPAIFLLSAYSLGNAVHLLFLKILKLESTKNNFAVLLQTLLGLVLYMYILGILAHFPINTSSTYSLIILCCFIINPKFCRLIKQQMINLSSMLKESNVFCSTFALLLFSSISTVVSLHALQVARHEMMPDALGMHLLVAHWIKQYSAWDFDVTKFIFSVMPLGVNWLYSVVYMFSGEFGARILNFYFMLILTIGITIPAWNKKNPTPALLSGLVFVSSPLVFVETSSLFVDHLWTALLLFSTFTGFYFIKKDNIAYLFYTTILISGAFLIKVTSIFYAAALSCFIFYALLKKLERRNILFIPILLFIFIAIGGSPYIYAYIATENPVFPFYNAVFKSPLYYSERSFEQPLFKTPLTISTLYNMTFQSQIYLESLHAALGFQYIIFALPVIFYCLLFPSLKTFMLLFITIFFFLFVHNAQAYLRYLLPAFATFSALLTYIILAWYKNHPILYRTASATILLVSVLNILCAPGGTWNYRSFPLLDTLKRNQALELSYKVQEIPLIKMINEKYDRNARILFADMGRTPYAQLNGAIYSNTWHNDETFQILNRSTTLDEFKAFILRNKITHFVSMSANDHPNVLVDQILKTCGKEEFKNHMAIAYTIQCP